MKCIITIGSLALLLPMGAMAAQKRPNVILIMSDDVGFEEYGIYGVLEGKSNTPNIDKFGREGVTFKTAWAQSLSGPSRAMLYTGCYAATTGAYDNKVQYRPEDGCVNDPTKFNAMTRVMKDAGYSVGVAGKWHFQAGENIVRPGNKLGVDEFMVWEENPVNYKRLTGVEPIFDEFCEHRTLGGARLLSRYWRPSMIKNGKAVHTTKRDYGPDMFCDFICDFIERKAKADEPFLALYPQVLAHGSHCVTPIEVAKGAERSNVNMRNTPNGIEYFRSQIRYADMLFAKVVDKVKELGIWDNTIIIYTSDNGTTSSSKSKGVEYGVHIPMMIGGGLVEKRGMSDELIDFTDILPTVAEFCDGELTKRVDGVSIAKFLRGKSNKTKDVIYSQPGVTSMIRTKDFLLEAVTPLCGHPEGRFYKTNGSYDGRGYENVTHDPKYAAERKKFNKYLDYMRSKLPYSFDDEIWQSDPKMKLGYKQFMDDTYRRLHLTIPKDYRFYDPTF